MHFVVAIVVFAVSVALFMTCTRQRKKLVREHDAFGNVRWICTPETTLAELQAAVQSNYSKKADILVGCRPETARALGAIHAGATTFVKRNQANCPFVNNGTAKSAGVGIYAEHEGQVYTLLHKDKSRRLLMAMGGSVEPEDLTLKSSAAREVREESAGRVRIGDEETNTPGIALQEGKLTLVAHVQFLSTYFDVDNIDDRYTRFGTHLSDMDFVSLLFDPRNKEEDCYKLRYVDHEETDFVFAVPWKRMNAEGSLKEKVGTLARKWDDTKPANVSTLALLLDHAFLVPGSLLGEVRVDSPIPHLPPTLCGIQFCGENTMA